MEISQRAEEVLFFRVRVDHDNLRLRVKALDEFSPITLKGTQIKHSA
jgi:hypothetical protein